LIRELAILSYIYVYVYDRYTICIERDELFLRSRKKKKKVQLNANDL
jgi:hypothetical protein